MCVRRFEVKQQGVSAAVLDVVWCCVVVCCGDASQGHHQYMQCWWWVLYCVMLGWSGGWCKPLWLGLLGAPWCLRACVAGDPRGVCACTVGGLTQHLGLCYVNPVCVRVCVLTLL